MNPFHPSSLTADRELAQARFARQIVVRLDEDAGRIGGDVAERLRFARERALARAQLVRSPTSAAPKVGITAAGAALLGAGAGWWVKLASIAPLVALVLGLVVIQLPILPFGRGPLLPAVGLLENERVLLPVQLRLDGLVMLQRV